MRKYDPLRRWLMKAPHPVEITFGGLAEIVGGLPPTAYRRSEWWANNRCGHVQAEAWLNAGRRVAHVDLAEERVRFS
jgi:hypothetical protein